MLKKAFTLIELLIVVAIIGILAAIAVPNFLNAQTRAKIARVQSEFRSISQAYEMYKLDNATYPGDHDLDEWTSQRGMFRLTSPIAYLSSIFGDPFVKQYQAGTGGNAYAANYVPAYEIGSGADNTGKYRKQAYSIVSMGPDMDDDIGNHDSFPFDVALTPYDGSNGLNSNGDLHLIAGDYTSGCLIMDRLSSNSIRKSRVGSGC